MRQIILTVEVLDKETGERLRSRRTFTDFHLQASTTPKYVAHEAQDQLNDLIRVLNKET